MADHFWVPGNSAGPHIEKPGKLLLHTTEGSSIEGAVAAYRANNSWPHITADVRFGHRYRVCHHIGYDVAARALRNQAGGVQTNTAGVIQIEVVGFATRPNEIDWAELGREVAGPICQEVGIPVTSTVTWVAYPASYGQQAPQRLSGPDWLAYRGILGHQHAPENSHGDPGAIPIQVLLKAANPTLPAEDDMPVVSHARDARNGAIWEVVNFSTRRWLSTPRQVDISLIYWDSKDVAVDSGDWSPEDIDDKGIVPGTPVPGDTAGRQRTATNEDVAWVGGKVDQVIDLLEPEEAVGPPPFQG